MVGRSFSTENVPTHQAFAFWHDLVCAHFIRLECASPRRGNFSGHINFQSFGDLDISLMQADEMHVRRNRKTIGLSGEEFFIIPIQGSSRTFGEQDGREFNLRPGDFAIFDSTRPYRASLLSRWQHCLLRVPRTLLKQKLGSIESLTGIRIPGDRGMGRIASVFLRSLPDELEHVDHSTGLRLSGTAVDLIAMAVAENFGLRPELSSTRTAHKMRAMNFVEANLMREDLSVAMLAKGLKLSPRYLNYLFENEELSLGRYISNWRLEQCRTALADTRSRGQTIAELAYQSGFSDMSHFSRAFRRRFGLSPREYRAKIIGEKNQA